MGTFAAHWPEGCTQGLQELLHTRALYAGGVSRPQMRVSHNGTRHIIID